MSNPELVVLAAGMGSRYGGLKQIDTVDDNGHIIIDYSIFDAIEAGFKSVTFIIKQEIEEEFRSVSNEFYMMTDDGGNYRQVRLSGAR